MELKSRQECHKFLFSGGLFISFFINQGVNFIESVYSSQYFR